MLKEFCRLAHACLVEYMQTALDLPDSLPGVVMCIHTFGEYLDFHPHLHALVADGLITRDGLFHVMPDVSLVPLEELFRARVIVFLTTPTKAMIARCIARDARSAFGVSC